jgi:hypothetical protein
MYRAAFGPLPSPKLMSAVTLVVVSNLMMGIRAVRMMIIFLIGILRYLMGGHTRGGVKRMGRGG